MGRDLTSPNFHICSGCGKKRKFSVRSGKFTKCKCTPVKPKPITLSRKPQLDDDTGYQSKWREFKVG